jgi:hypothetical protein
MKEIPSSYQTLGDRFRYLRAVDKCMTIFVLTPAFLASWRSTPLAKSVADLLGSGYDDLSAERCHP